MYINDLFQASVKAKALQFSPPHLFDVSVLAVVSRSVGRIVGDAAAAREDRLGRLESLRGERVALADADGLLDGALDEDDADQGREVLLSESERGKIN